MSSDVEDESRKWVWGPYGLVEKGPQPGRCLVNTCLCGPLLVWHSVNIYLYPCIQIVLQKVCCWMLCLCCTCECWRFRDKQFPPSEESLGNFEAKGTCGPVEWKKCDEICTRGSTAGRANLFENGVDCKDIAQGALGDCWLLSALACLSEPPPAACMAVTCGCTGGNSHTPRHLYTGASPSSRARSSARSSTSAGARAASTRSGSTTTRRRRSSASPSTTRSRARRTRATRTATSRCSRRTTATRCGSC